MQTVASSGPTIVPEIPYQGYSSVMPSYNHPAGNNFNNNSFGTNHTFMQDTWINQAMARELQKLKDMISSVPGVVRPIPEIPDGSCYGWNSELVS